MSIKLQQTRLKFFLSGLCLILAHSFVYGQENFRGKVVDINHLPIEGVQIQVASTSQHAHSDAQGNFVLKQVNKGDTLKTFHISYFTSTFVVSDPQAPVELVLKEKAVSLSEVIITPDKDPMHLVADFDLKTNPVNNSQEILRQVPGLFIGQHAGGGKAEQIFLRGFDNDHGTDIALSLDGMPINMVSHAHGQGYADLHFIIPETIENIEYGKGPYYADQGNFNTSGYVSMKTKEQVHSSTVKLEAGQFNSHRLMGMFNLVDKKGQNAYVASEFLATDGPFVSPQNFNRINLFGKYTAAVSPDEKLGVEISHFTSKWDASGQVPNRAVESGMITRFGAIDDTEGGSTSRTNLILSHEKSLDPQSSINNTVYFSDYNFELFSNFTFYLNDPINGDQIKQKEHRQLYGLKSEYFRTLPFGNVSGGISLRTDQVDGSELSHTLNRKAVLDSMKFGDIHETNVGLFANANFDLGDWRINPAIRYDYFDFQYNDVLQPIYQTQSNAKGIISPKLNILYNGYEAIQFYLKTGKGFHSNDTRVVVAQDGYRILPAAYGTDIGFIWKPFPYLLVNTAYWYLYLQQEFVYVGDEGIVEPSGKSQRQGVDLSLRYQPLSWLYWNADATYAHGRFVDEAEGKDNIPLALNFTLTSSLNILHPKGYYGGISVRHIGDRPANEDNSIVAKGYTVMDLNGGYKWKNISLGFQIQNLLDTEWNETQFATESRLQDEPAPVDEIHFTPGTPFYFRALLQFTF